MGFNLNQFKVILKLAMNRSKLLQAKKRSLQQHQRKELADLLLAGKVESARIRVEHVIREDYHMEAMEVIEMLCDLLLARSGLLEMKQCDPAIQEAVHTVIYAASRSEIKELTQARDQLVQKFGRDFGEAAQLNRLGLVNPRVLQRLQVSTPDPALVSAYLREIAKTFNVPFDEQLAPTEGEYMTMTMAAATTVAAAAAAQPWQRGNVANGEVPLPFQAQPSSVSVVAPPAQLTTPAARMPPLPGDAEVTAAVVMPSPPSQPMPAEMDEKPVADDLPDFDQLARRFEELKKRG